MVDAEVVAAIFGSCPELTSLNLSECDVGAAALLPAVRALADDGTAPRLALEVVDLQGNPRLGGETFALLTRCCPGLRELAFGYCCAEEPLDGGEARVLTDQDLSSLEGCACASGLRTLKLGAMGRRSGDNNPTVGRAAFGTRGIRSLAGAVPSLQILDLAHSVADNPTVCAVAKACPDLQRLNVASTRCTREVHRMLREFGSEARVFGA